MAKVSFLKKIGLFLLLVSFLTTPIQATPWEWIKDHKQMIFTGTAIMGLLVAIHVIVPTFAKRYIEQVINSARQAVSDNHVDKNYQSVDTSTKEMLQQKKAALITKTKTQIQSGILVAGTSSFNGSMNIAHAISFLHQSFSGEGLITHCLSFMNTTFDGNFIAETCAFKGEVTLNPGTTIVSFNKSFLGSLKSKAEKVVVELLDTVVAGDIVFEHEGIIVMDKKSVLGGNIVNGMIVHI